MKGQAIILGLVRAYGIAMYLKGVNNGDAKLEAVHRREASFAYQKLETALRKAKTK